MSRKNVENSKYQRPGKVDMSHVPAVYSRSSSESSSSDDTYVNNALNRKLGRVGMKRGTAVYSRKQHYVHNEADKKLDKGEHEAASKSKETTEKRVYVDNSFNRKHNRVGLPLGSMPIPRQNGVYKDNRKNRELGRVGKPWGTHVVKKKKQAELRKHLEEHFDEEVPAELNDMSDDAVSHVLEFKEREDALEKFLEENASTNWKPHEHTLAETIKRYKGNIIDFEKLQMRYKIGHGGFGEVYFASLDGEAVAVKKLKFQQLTKKRLQQFVKEMKVFLELENPNIVSLLGACTVIPNLAIVMELMDMSLYDAIHIKEVDFTMDDKVDIVRGITKGLAYLHHQDIAHCDLKTQNVLLINVPGEPLTDNNEPVLAKITDFGLSKIKSDMETSSSIPNVHFGTPRYAAPELHQGKILKLDELKKADMYSLGLLIWELAVEEIPFEDLNYQQLKVQVGEKGLTPVEPENLRLDGKLHDSLSLCWSMMPDKRPSAKDMAEIAECLTTLLEKEEE